MKKFLGITLAVLLLLSAPLQAVSTYVDNSITVTGLIRHKNKPRSCKACCIIAVAGFECHPHILRYFRH